MSEGIGKRVFARLSVVRLLVFFFAIMAAYVFFSQFGLHQIYLHVPRKYVGAATFTFVLGYVAVLAGLYVLLVRLFERRWPGELELSRGTPLLLLGALLGLFLFCAVYAVLFANGNAVWRGFLGYDNAAHFALWAVLAGVGEELAFRGGVFRILEDSFGTAIALILSGALFGALHMLNPHANLFSSLAIALEAGIMLAAAYAATRNLWLPIGIHIGWNFTEGGIFGAAVSGNGAGRGILDVPLNGPPLLTGGEFGPEASVIAIGVCLLLGLAFIVQTVRRGRWVPASFNMLLD